MKTKASALFFSLLLLVTTACKNKDTATDGSATTGELAEITFEKNEHDFGNVTQGDKVSYDFEFTNTGQNDLVIADAKGSCGCTVPEYPKTPIKPGDGGTIKVSFDTTGKSGQNTKSVTLTCNIKEQKKFIIVRANIETSTTIK